MLVVNEQFDCFVWTMHLLGREPHVKSRVLLLLKGAVYSERQVSGEFKPGENPLNGDS